MTLNGEVMLFWLPRQVNGATALFLLNRYISLAAQLLACMPVPSSFQVAVAGYVAFYVMQSLQYFHWATFSAPRMHALYSGRYKWIVSATVFVLALVPLVINMAVSSPDTGPFWRPSNRALNIHSATYDLSLMRTIPGKA
ncbi:hypothetical protein BD311DRAFT_726709 [Dichomitus squalens]|uniref:Uncharacterized protein n=2 Tax=Dichomitus squalens TaxID=114155 RepID=A0A4Q9MJ74_9APHY|nr:hypothetical protein BD311DRAFT_726709 [Dichomitus squalens]